MPAAPAFVSRLERFARVDSTQRVVRDWLDTGVPEVAIAVADHQSAGRGRLGRAWSAPPGASLLVSAGFRPPDLGIRHGWRLAAVAAIAMLDAAHEVAALAPGTIALKWPNDLVTADPDEEPRKLAGVLGEAVVADDRVASAVVGIGVNADWPPDAFPPELAAAMTSLAALAPGRAIDREALLGAWLVRLDEGYAGLRAGRFDAPRWAAVQRTTGHRVRVNVADGTIEGGAVGVDPDTGDLLVQVPGEASSRSVASGDVIRCRVV